MLLKFFEMLAFLRLTVFWTKGWELLKRLRLVGKELFAMQGLVLAQENLQELLLREKMKFEQTIRFWT